MIIKTLKNREIESKIYGFNYVEINSWIVKTHKVTRYFQKFHFNLKFPNLILHHSHLKFLHLNHLEFLTI